MPILSLTERSCKASNCRQFSTNINIKIIKSLGANKAGFNLILFHFNIGGKLSRYDAINTKSKKLRKALKKYSFDQFNHNLISIKSLTFVLLTL